jgi:hypothetical protein
MADPAETSKDRYAQHWFIGGLGLVGAAIGYLVALSESPVVGIVLPLIFGLIGGAGGIYAAREDLGSETGRQRLGLIGKSVVALCLAMIIASAGVLKFHEKVGPSGSAILTKLPESSHLTGNQLSSLLDLRAKLEARGASIDEQTEVLKRLTTPETSAEASKKLRAISDQIAAALSSLNSTPPNANQSDSIVVSKITRLKTVLAARLPLIKKWADDLGANKDIPLAAASKQLESTATELLDPISALSGADGYSGALEGIFELQVALSENRLRVVPEKVTALQSPDPNDKSASTAPLPYYLADFNSRFQQSVVCDH